MKRINLFLAYAPEDATYREKIGKHLSILKTNGFINDFCLSEVLPGSDSDLSIRTLMNDAKIILLLISSDFLASDECRRLEDLAFSIKMRNDAIVIPVLLRPCIYDESYDKLQILPDNKKPISDTNAWSDEDAALTNIAERIKQLVVKIRADEKPIFSNKTTSENAFEKTESITESKPTSPNNSRKRIVGIAVLSLIGLLAFLLWPSSNSSSFPKKRVTTQQDISNATIKPSTTKPTLQPVTHSTPKLINTNWKEASKKLKSIGITSHNIKEVVSCDFKPGTVMKQNPTTASPIKEGETVSVQIAVAPKRISAAPISGGGKLISLKNGGKYSQNAWAIKNTNVEFSLEGTSCSRADITVDHPLGGTQKHSLRAGQKKNNSRFFGVGTIKVYFSTNDPNARLKLKIW